MSSGTYSQSYGSGIQLTGRYSSVTVATGAYAYSTGAALFAYGGGTYSLDNLGTLVSGGGDAIYLDGTVVNESIGLVAGEGNGIVLTAAGDAVYNAGLIEGGTGYGIDLQQGGSITNAAHGTISGAGGITLGGAGTVENAGTIAGTSGYSLVFSSSADVLDVESGADFVGLVQGGGGTLEFGGGGGTETGLGSGTLTGSVTAEITGFAAYLVASGAAWTLDGTNAIGAGETLAVDGTLVVDGGVLIDRTVLEGGTVDISNGGIVDLVAGAASAVIEFTDATGTLQLGDPAGVTVAGFTAGDVIDLTGVTYDSGHMTATYAAGELNVYDAGSLVASVAMTGVAGDAFRAEDDGTGDTKIVCFVAGTRILTDHGEVAVEKLRVGDRVRTLSGHGDALQPIKWIGRRRIDAARHPRPDKAFPIRIRKDAFARDLPRRDLLVSPGHALLVDGRLVAAWHLVNGATIVQDRGRPTVEYYHVELARHDVLVAEGLPAESYRDCGNRGFFDNSDVPIVLHGEPDAGLAELCRSGPELAAIKAGLLARVAAAGWRIGRQAELRLHVDGKARRPIAIAGPVHRFALTQPFGAVRLISAAASLAETGAGCFDHRRLGVPVLRIEEIQGNRRRRIALTDPARFVDGWHGLDGGPGRQWRWTDGNASLPIDRPCILEVTIGAPVARWLPAPLFRTEAAFA
jgi:hypothetical protein